MHAVICLVCKVLPGRMCFMPMHKGMDGFLSTEHYAEFYWPYPMKIVNAWIDAGAIPSVYTEASYDGRVEFLKQLPPGKCIVHFEESRDIEMLKRENVEALFEVIKDYGKY